MLTKRIIPCLDVDRGRVVKGINFTDIKDIGDPVQLAKFYNEQGADELVFLDITATKEDRSTVVNLVNSISRELFIPFTVGGGIKSLKDIKLLLRSGADKISINSAAVRNPQLIKQASQKFGSQSIVVAIDVKYEKNDWYVYISGGSEKTEIKALEWVMEVQQLGAGELLVTSMDRDGTKDGYDIKLYEYISDFTDIPLIASGGAKNMNSFKKLFEKDVVDAALAASVFHYNKIRISKLKQFLHYHNVEVRI